MKAKRYFLLTMMAILASLTMQFTSCEKEDTTVTDIDGNTYKTVSIGNQIWMAENLKTTTYKDGTPITLIEDRVTWGNLSTEAYCWYDNDQTAYGDTYGAIYNYYAVATRNLCPDGWRVASREDWKALDEYLTDNGHDGTEGTALKATNGWENDGNGTDDYGFSALPGGRRNYSFNDAGRFSCWWVTGSPAGHGSTAKLLIDQRSDISQIGTDMRVGFSVRCVTY